MIIEISGGDSQLLNKLKQSAIDSLNQINALFRKGIDYRDEIPIGQCVHKIRSVGSVLEMDTILADAEKIRKRLKKGQSEGIQNWQEIKRFQKEINELIHAVNQLSSTSN